MQPVLHNGFIKWLWHLYMTLAVKNGCKIPKQTKPKLYVYVYIIDLTGQWEPPPGVDLLVTNLDNQMTRKELKRFLSAAIADNAKVRK